MIASWGRELGSSFLSPSFVWLVSRLTFPHSCLSASRLGSCRLPTGSATPLAATRLGPLRGERSETRRGRRGKSGGRRRHQTRETTDDRGKGTYEWWILLWILWVSFHFIIKSIKSAIHPLSAVSSSHSVPSLYTAHPRSLRGLSGSSQPCPTSPVQSQP